MGLQEGSKEDESTNNLGDATQGNGGLDQLVIGQRLSKLGSPLPFKEGMNIEVVENINQPFLIHTNNFEVVVWRTLKLLDRLNYESKVKTIEG